MPIKIRLQPPVSVETPDGQHSRMFVDINGVAKVKYPSGEVVDLTAMVGPAGGDLSGTYPNPSVDVTAGLKTTGATVSTAAAAPPVSGRVITATSSTTATWQTVPALPPSGVAGGDLVGNYPNPTALRANALSSSTTSVAVSSADAPTAGQLLTAIDDSNAEWQNPPNLTPTGPAGGDLSGSYPDPAVEAAASLKSLTTSVVTSLSAAPTAGRLLVANSGVSAGWLQPSLDLGGTWNAPTVVQARGLKSATTIVDVASAAAPSSGQILRATSSTTATWQVLDQYMRNAVWDPPLSPDSVDQEFITDPFVSGEWVVQTNSDLVISYKTRAGNVDVSINPSPNTYRSTVVGSTVFIQVPHGEDVVCRPTNPIVGATSGDQFWMCGIGYVSMLSPTAGRPFHLLQLFADSGGTPDFDNRAFCGSWNFDTGGASGDFHCGVVSGGTFTQGPTFVSDAMSLGGVPGFFMRKGATQQSGSGASSITFGMFSPSGSIAGSSTLGTSFPGLWVWPSITIVPWNSNNWGAAAWGGGSITALHFLRRKLGSTAGIIG